MSYLFFRFIVVSFFLTLVSSSSATCSHYYTTPYDDISNHHQRTIVKPLTLFLINPTSKNQQIWQNNHVTLLGKLTQPRHFNLLMEGIDNAKEYYDRRRAYSATEQFSIAQFFFKPLIKRLQEMDGETYKKKGVFKALFRGISSRRFYNDCIQSLLLTNENDKNFNGYIIPVFLNFLKARTGP